MAEGLGIQGAQRVPSQAAQSALQLGQQPTVMQLANGVPGLARVPLPPRQPDEPQHRPKKAAAQMGAPRDMRGGSSPLSTAAVADTADAVEQLGSHDAPVEERGQRQGRVGSDQLPQANGLMAFARTRRGELVYLEADRWHNHIKPHHVTEPPNARGKRTTTWWPVLHSATGAQTMSEQQVVRVIMDAVRDGNWQNAPRGTLLSVYELPDGEARQFGVSEVKVSAAPDGRILSAYPSRGSNVLAVRELSAEEQAQLQQAQLQPASAASGGDDDRLFRTNVPQTTFG